MVAGRKGLVDEVAAQAGPEVISVRSRGSGWPADVDVITDGRATRVSLHVGPVGPSQRGRDDVERRFQNPGSDKPVTALAGQLPILLGVWTETGRTIFVGLNGASRIGRTTRFSLFVPLHTLRMAAVQGWAEHYNTSDEKIIAFLPGLLPVFVQLVQASVEIKPADVSAIVAAAGMTDEQDYAAERGRRTVSTLVRDAVFSRTVREAYGGMCAMCGLNFSLVVGAHIFPVAAPGATDSSWNGVALCHNHHAVFDAHKLYVDPDTKKIDVHPDLVSGKSKSDACRNFVESTFAELRQPTSEIHKPRREMFVERYRFFSSKYEWAID